MNYFEYPVEFDAIKEKKIYNFEIFNFMENVLKYHNYGIYNARFSVQFFVSSLDKYGIF